jgi:DHA1 family multidrug/chloramphenicol efflux transport protein-like MFS transporter
MSYQPITQLGLRVLWFPLFLVLFEFSTYIANDMIMPGMLLVVREYGASSALVPSAMTVYLLGGASLQWFLGPLSDKIGRRPVLLWGVLGFMLTSLLICFSPNMAWFMVLRVVQGMGMCFVGAVGYAAIQEAFAEKPAIQVTAMMLNVALLAPLIGPLSGVAVLGHMGWRMIFVAIALLALLAGIGLWYCMPETSPRQAASLGLPTLLRAYWQAAKNRRFMLGVLAGGMAWVPMLAWIGSSPVFIMEAAHGSATDYGLWQLPVIGAIILGSFLLAGLTRHGKSSTFVMLGAALILGGLVLSLVLCQRFGVAYQGLAWGLALYASGLGLANAGLYRMTLAASSQAIGLLSAAYGLLSMIIFALGVELGKVAYQSHGITGFALFNLLCGGGYLLLLAAFLRGHLADSLPD